MNRRRLSLLIAVVLVTITMFSALATPKAASAAGEYCFINGMGGEFYDNTLYPSEHVGDNKFGMTFPNGQQVVAYVQITDIGGGWYHFVYTNSVSDCTTTFHDGRINNRDGGQTVAVYCTGGETGGIFTLIPARPVWKLGLVATAAEIAAVKPNANHPVLIKKKGHVSLYRLQDGSLQINAPGLNPTKEDYNFIFKNCGA